MKVAISWYNGKGQIEYFRNMGLSSPEFKKICFMDRSISGWSPKDGETYVHQILGEIKKGERQGVFFAGLGELIDVYKAKIIEMVRKRAVEIISEKVARCKFSGTVNTDETPISFSGEVRKSFGKSCYVVWADDLLKGECYSLPEEIEEKIKGKEEKEEKIKQVVSVLTEPQDSIVVDGEIFQLVWEKNPSKDCQFGANFAWHIPETKLRGHIVSLYQDCCDYRIGTATEHAYAFVQFFASHLCAGKKITPALMAKIGAADFNSDKMRLTEANKQILNLGKSAIQAELKRRMIYLSTFTELEQPASHLAQLVVRRGVVELAMKYGKIHNIKEYKKYAAELAVRILDYLLGSNEMLEFDFRIFPKSVGKVKKHDFSNRYGKYREEYQKMEETVGDETWWIELIEAYSDLRPICYEAVVAIPHEMYNLLLKEGWRDKTNSQAETGELLPPMGIE